MCVIRVDKVSICTTTTKYPTIEESVCLLVMGNVKGGGVELEGLLFFIISLIELCKQCECSALTQGRLILKNMKKPKRYLLTKLKQIGRAVVEQIYRSGYHIASLNPSITLFIK